MSSLSTKHFIGLEHATSEDMNKIIETAYSFREVLERPIKKVPSLNGKNILNLFLRTIAVPRKKIRYIKPRYRKNLSKEGWKVT